MQCATVRTSAGSQSNDGKRSKFRLTFGRRVLADLFGLEDKSKPYGYDFTRSCYRHDFGYANYQEQKRFSEPNRQKIDENFRKDMFEGSLFHLSAPSSPRYCRPLCLQCLVQCAPKSLPRSSSNAMSSQGLTSAQCALGEGCEYKQLEAQHCRSLRIIQSKWEPRLPVRLPQA